MSDPREKKAEENQKEKELRRRETYEDETRPESDGEDFNEGGKSRARTEATGEDF